MTVHISAIRQAEALLKGQVVRTPQVPAPALSAAIDGDVVLKLENMQFTNSFKARGAYVKLDSLTAEERARGVIAMSAGNHAQGVAFHANRLGIPATIVMPAQTPFSKVERTRQHGANVVLHGRTLDDSRERAAELIEEHDYILVHPYDDPAIIAGQGTVGLEMLADNPEIDSLVVPIGGGGLISGVAIAAKEVKPSIRIIGVEAELYPSMTQELAGSLPTSGGETIAEGIAVKSPGQITKEIIREHVDEILLVTESELESAVHYLVEHQKIVAEGAGAAGVAALLKHREMFAGAKVGAVICGGNIDARLLASVMMRGLVRDGRLIRLRIEISDEPGVLAKIAQIIGETGGNIVEVYHHRMFQDVPIKLAELDTVIETRNIDHVVEIVTQIESAGYKTRLLSATTEARE